MIRRGAGDAEAALDRVEAVHRVGFALEVSPFGEPLGRADRVGLGPEEIGIERDDDRGGFEVVPGLQRLPEGQLRSFEDRLVA